MMRTGLFVVAGLALLAAQGCNQGDLTPPADVDDFVAVAGDHCVVLTWTSPINPDYSGVMIRR